MKCINNTDYEDCLTIGKFYDVETEIIAHGVLRKTIDDNGEPLQTMIDRFE